MSRNRTIVHVAVLAGLLAAAGGCQWCHKKAEPEPAGVPEPIPATECGLYINAQTYPRAGVVRVEKNMPDQVQVNAPFDYTITVTNISDKPLENVTVTERLGSNFKFIRAEPSGTEEGGQVMWSLGSMAAGESRDIKVSGSATTTDCIKQCAGVTYDIPTCGFTSVVNPQLKLTMTAPTTISLCDEIPLTYTVWNEGTGEATSVIVTSDLPDGLKTSEGEQKVALQVGSLQPGQSREYNVTAKAQRTGDFVAKAEGEAGGGVTAESNVVTTTVTQPVFEIDHTGPAMQYMGHPIRLSIIVKNVGSGPAMNTVVEETLPEGSIDVTPSENGQTMGAKAVWNLGTLAVEESKELTVSFTANRAGAFTSTATVSATCAETVTAEVGTQVSGIAGILLEVIDTADPVEVGQDETYLVTVTNQGSAPDTNILIHCELEPSMKYVSSSGPTMVSEHDGAVTFEPLKELVPGGKATWKIVVRGVQPADARFKATMTSDVLGRDVHETEATHFYTTK